jgi:hypothetical protein
VYNSAAYTIKEFTIDRWYKISLQATEGAPFNNTVWKTIVITTK